MQGAGGGSAGGREAAAAATSPPRSRPAAGRHRTLGVWVDGHHAQTIDVAGVPRIYTLYQAGSSTTGTLLLRPAPGVQACDFTFG